MTVASLRAFAALTDPRMFAFGSLIGLTAREWPPGGGRVYLHEKSLLLSEASPMGCVGSADVLADVAGDPAGDESGATDGAFLSHHVLQSLTALNNSLGTKDTLEHR